MNAKENRQENNESCIKNYPLVSRPHLYRQVWPCGHSQILALINQEWTSRSDS